jgi:hypothetical protein
VSIGTGTRLGQYEVQDFIGQGAMGLVYKAYHADLERTGAVKVLQAITPDADTVARFRHEAQAIAQLRHPNIVNVYDFGAFQGIPYMIVEYIPGGSLSARMARGDIDQATAIRYLRGIAAGLDYAHVHGVVHRDVKPANVLLTAEDTPVLADFGLAKLLQGSSLKSMTGVTTGTPAYMAPEQVTGHQVGPAADRYSLATIAYEMLTGVIPFDGEALMELLYAQVHREPLTPSARLPTLGPAVDAVIMRGLAKDPAGRWNSCTEFVDALAAALTGGPAQVVDRTAVYSPQMASTVPLAGAAVAERVAARPAQAATVAMAYPAPTVGSPPLPSAAPKRHSRRRWLIGAAAFLVLLLVLGVCAIAAQATTLTVNPGTAARGDVVRVTAAHVPANQAGEIQMWSVVHTFPFRADANGDVAMDLMVPHDINLGDHVLKICWSNACHKQTTLHVVYGIAEAQPTPAGNQTPSLGSTPRPTSTPTSRPTLTPTSPPTSYPKPSPTPTPSVTLISVSQLGNTKVTFHYFYAGSTTVFVCQNGTCHGAGTASVPAGADVVVIFKTPVGIALAPVGGPAYVQTACCGWTNSVSVGA